MHLLQVSGLAMSVSCGLTQCGEAWQAAMESEARLEDLAVSSDLRSEKNTELATLYLEARRKLEELKLQLKNQSTTDDIHNEGATSNLKLLSTVEGI